MDTVELIGTTAQIKWATSIRTTMMRKLNIMIQESDGNFTELEEEAISEFKTRNSASWWIENRNYGITFVLSDLMREILADEEQEEQAQEPEPMTKSEIFRTAHAIARSIRANCDSYRTAFALALREVYAQMRESQLQAA